MKKEYESPEFMCHKLEIYDIICLSNPEGVGGGGSWGGEGEDEDGGAKGRSYPDAIF